MKKIPEPKNPNDLWCSGCEAYKLLELETVNKNVDLSGTAFGEVDQRGDAASFISYLDQATHQFVGIKTFTHSLLGLKLWERVSLLPSSSRILTMRPS